MNSENASVMNILAKCGRGLEDLTAEEMMSLGGTEIQTFSRGVVFKGDRSILYKANIYSKFASAILMELFSLPFESKEEAGKIVRDADWPSWFGLNETFCVNARTDNPIFSHSQYAAQFAKDMIVDSFRAKFGQRPSVDTKDPDVRIEMLFREGTINGYLNSSGHPLNERGYRLRAGAAPLRESLAAAVIALSGWDGKEQLIDGMCGSGTFVIEAAMLAMEKAPGSHRYFSFMKWKDYDESLFSELRRSASAKIKSMEGPKIIGVDKDPGIIPIARDNAARAGVSISVDLQQEDFFEFTPPPGGGVVIMNPPYGERMALETRKEFYKKLGDTMKQRYKGYRIFILTGDLEAHKMLGLKTSSKKILYNGGIECRLLGYSIYEGSVKRKYQNPDESEK